MPEQAIQAVTVIERLKSALHPAGEGSQYEGFCAGDYTIQTTTLQELGRQVQGRLGTGNVRMVGDPQLPVTRLAMTAHRLSSCPRLLTDNDAVLMAEPREFDTFEYFRDAEALGIRKGLIAISHERAEEWGMLRPCAEWVHSMVPEVPIAPLSTNESYWLLPETG